MAFLSIANLAFLSIAKLGFLEHSTRIQFLKGWQVGIYTARSSITPVSLEVMLVLIPFDYMGPFALGEGGMECDLHIPSTKKHAGKLWADGYETTLPSPYFCTIFPLYSVYTLLKVSRPPHVNISFKSLLLS